MELANPVHIPEKMFFKIGEVATIADVKPYVLRYWETEFAFLSPNKSNSQQRMYSRTDVENILLIKHLLYDLRYSIEGARKRISEMRRQGELAEARKPRVTLDSDRISRARAELRQLIELCRMDH